MQPANKREAVEQMLAKGDAMICLDSGYPGVKVPENHKGKDDLRLVLNLNFRHSITTLPEGIQAELLFGGAPYLCWIPYESLWAVYNPQTGDGYLWPGDTPVRLRDLLVDGKEGDEKKGASKEPGPEQAPATEIPEEPDKEERPRFRVIPGGKKD